MFGDTNDNPYVAVVAKKHRNLKKKMDRILKIETQIQAGKPLDEEQKIMYTTKSSVEKSLTDLKAILTAFEEVSKEVCEKGKEIPSELKHETSHESNTHEGTEETKGESSVGIEVGIDQTVAAATTTTDTTVIETKQVAIIEEDALEENVNTTTTTSSSISTDAMLSILKALHVFHRYTLVVGRHLPEPVLCFLHTLLGLPGPEQLNPMLPPQEMFLTTSMEVLQRYMHDEVMLAVVDSLHSEMLLAPPCLLPPFLPFPFSPVHPISSGSIELPGTASMAVEDGSLLYNTSNSDMHSGDDIAATTAQFLQELSSASAVEHTTTTITTTTSTIHNDNSEEVVHISTNATAPTVETTTTPTEDTDKATKRTRTRRSRNNKKGNILDSKEIPTIDSSTTTLPVEIKLVPKNSTIMNVEEEDISFFPAVENDNIDISSGNSNSLLSGLPGFGITTTVTTNGMVESEATNTPTTASTVVDATDNKRRKRRNNTNKKIPENEIQVNAVDRESTVDLANTATVADTIPIIPVRGVGAALAYINSLQAAQSTTTTSTSATTSLAPVVVEEKEKSLDKKEVKQAQQRVKKTNLQQPPYTITNTNIPSIIQSEIVNNVVPNSTSVVVEEHSAESSSTPTVSVTAETVEYLRRVRGSRGRGGRNRPTTTSVPRQSSTTIADTNSNTAPTTTSTTIKSIPQPSETKKPIKVVNKDIIKPAFKPREDNTKSRSSYTKKPILTTTEK